MKTKIAQTAGLSHNVFCFKYRSMKIPLSDANYVACCQIVITCNYGPMVQSPCMYESMKSLLNNMYSLYIHTCFLILGIREALHILIEWKLTLRGVLVASDVIAPNGHGTLRYQCYGFWLLFRK